MDESTGRGHEEQGSSQPSRHTSQQHQGQDIPIYPQQAWTGAPASQQLPLAPPQGSIYQQQQAANLGRMSEQPLHQAGAGLPPQGLDYQHQQQQQAVAYQLQQQSVAAAAAHYGGYPRQPYMGGPPGGMPMAAGPYYQQSTQPHQQIPPATYGQHQLQPPPRGVAATAGIPHPNPLPPSVISNQLPYLQPKIGRLPSDRPLMKLSVSLIDTYKHINTVYYEEREARRAARAKGKGKSGTISGSGAPTTSAATSVAAPGPGNAGGTGTHNHGWDDENYDYIVTAGELFYGRYRIKERIGKGSFGQVVRAEDTETGKDVAIKIIKSKKPFLIQAKTEIELLAHLNDKDAEDQHNIVRLLTHFMYRNHQCLVFEMLSLNLYELLKNTQFGGVSLNLIRKFAKQVLRALSFLARRDVDIIHCDLKPENILLKHPKKSGVKVIDFGSSCRSNKRMYSYIQSRFYRSPEVMLGLPYSTAIDMWSLGCILAEMHTGEPLFSGSDQFDQMQKIVRLLGMIPITMLDQATDQNRLQFFEKKILSSGLEDWTIRQVRTVSSSSSKSSQQQQQQQQPKSPIIPSADPVASLTNVIATERGKTNKNFPAGGEARNTAANYERFIDLVHQMLAYDPRARITPSEALNHPFITDGGDLSKR